MSPLSGFSSPEIIFTNVVLPAPLWPKRQKISDGNKSPLKLFTAKTSGNDLDMQLIDKQFFEFKYSNWWAFNCSWYIFSPSL